MSPRALVEQYGRNATAWQALHPALSRWARPDAFVGYAGAVRRPWGGRARVVAGEPAAHPERVVERALAFEAESASAGEEVIWFGATAQFAERLRASRPGGALVVGAQPVWQPGRWREILASKSSLRAQIHRARNKAARVDEWAPDASTAPVERIRLEWLSTRGLPPLGFLVETDVLDDLAPRRLFVASVPKGVVGYLTLLPIPARDGWLVEWIVQGQHAPNGTASLLLDAAFRAVREAAMLTLGMVPLSTHAPLTDPAPPRHVRALLAWMRAHARRFYNFEGLERFKAKFKPDAWEPLWLLTTRPRVDLGTLHAVADAFAGSRSPESLIATALARAASQEARALRRAISGSSARSWTG